ncbi:MAG: anti-sigma factor [Actinomycetota bacterium]|nr:anti-sigma factor [Actinomycetota bacterium]
MTDDLSHSEIQELLGAYALDAVDDHERAIIESHLLTCESCRVELDDHRRLAETLRRHATRVSPLASTESNGSARTTNHIAPRSRLWRWAAPLATAIVVLLVGAGFVQGQIRYDHLTATTARIERLQRAQLATADPAAVVTELRTPSNQPVLTVVNLGGSSYVINGALPRLGRGRSYQLWRVDDTGGIAAAATLGPHPDAAAFSLPASVTGFVLTVENTPTPSRPTLPAIASSGGLSP